jgi:hypothetical protein
LIKKSRMENLVPLAPFLSGTVLFCTTIEQISKNTSIVSLETRKATSSKFFSSIILKEALTNNFIF